MKEWIHYSEAFKLQVVRELEEGKHGSCSAAAEAYGIRGHRTVRGWIERYGKTHLLAKVVQVQTPDERSELKKLKDRVRALEKALVDAHLDLRLEKAWLGLACKAGGIEDVDVFKKKHHGMQSTAWPTEPKA